MTFFNILIVFEAARFDNAKQGRGRDILLNE